MSTRENLTRKELSALCGLSPDILRRNEKRLGLDICKVTVNRRVILYRRRDSLKALAACGFALPA